LGWRHIGQALSGSPVKFPGRSWFASHPISPKLRLTTSSPHWSDSPNDSHDVKILEEMKKGTIVIEPFDRKHLGSNSYDVHLGKDLATYKNEILDAMMHNQVDPFRDPRGRLDPSPAPFLPRRDRGIHRKPMPTFRSLREEQASVVSGSIFTRRRGKETSASATLDTGESP